MYLCISYWREIENCIYFVSFGKMKCSNQGISMIYIILIVLLNLAIGAKGGRREDKVFSLFNIVRFPNSACSGDSYTGTCLTSTECSSKVKLIILGMIVFWVSLLCKI